ncbi:uncharacterized protein EAE97_001364 [Botrytis byssoidea]|uniref:Uncharacterized protein n=1 Tax=Botrytis byssoidea TaxID=139641 RepID=A0A9P5IUC9_9HELO|nr:uncharacterized protein EAE97_001364 [Botrytis byssoidea]KAF7953966.1 hypothetical protein EAE97_001364 [Botrytis byssoidea]
MNYEEFPTENGTVPETARRKISPMSFMAHKLRELKRPSRLRSRIFFSLIFISSVILIVLGKWHAYKIQHSASQLGSYVPEKLAGAFAPYTIIENSDWDDTIPFPNNETNTNTDTNPKFHLIIPACKKSLNLCKTLLTASILNYPPLTLLGFKLKSDETEEKEDKASALQEIQDMLDFLNGKDMQDDDLVLLLNANTWLQLPGEVIIERFLRNRREVNEKLREEYGVEKGIEAGTEMIRKLGQQKYTQKVLFAARKDCAVVDRGERGDAEERRGEPCYENMIPQFPLLKNQGGKINQYREYPHFIESSAGYEGTLESSMGDCARAEWGWESNEGMFGAGDYGADFWRTGREEGGKTECGRLEMDGVVGGDFEGFDCWRGEGEGWTTKWRDEWESDVGGRGNSERSDGEFGIGVDYTLGIFYTVENSGEELKVTTFSEKEKRIVSRRGVVKGPVRDITMLSGEWENIPGPLDLCRIPDIDIDKDADNEKEISQSVQDLRAAREKNISWDSIPLLTYSDGDGDGGFRGVNSNPRVPVSFSFGLGSDSDSGLSGNDTNKEIEKEKEEYRKKEETSQKQIWEKTWWKTWGKQLWEKCTKGVEEQRWVVGGDGEGKGKKGEEGGIWVDGRGGRGGVWTGERVWIEWGEVCAGEVMDEIWGS